MDDQHHDRVLTDADVEAIVTKLRAEITRQFYNDLGRGVWSAVLSLLVAIALLFAAWGAKTGGVHIESMSK